MLLLAVPWASILSMPCGMLDNATPAPDLGCLAKEADAVA
jgi:hypothetical protein